jgi:PAB-dependent poly(A)-specific ribonuclease subunit 3
VYKGISSADGMAYAIRRIDGFRLSNEHALKLADQWKQVTSNDFCNNTDQVQHPGIVTLSTTFISKDFGEVNGLQRRCAFQLFFSPVLCVPLPS